ncbi:hypothetical protein ACXYTP_24280 [Tsukamurella ocularis]|uniref:hypothetical protein n=1 Tax=Tsukamurella ocularis TaxID=1970234 RepID=UPI0039EF8115
MEIPLIVGVVAYVITGFILGKIYYQRRHGVYSPLFGPGAKNPTRIAFAFAWPVMMLLRKSELCTCRDHVMERAQARQEYDAYNSALRNERGGY